MTRPCQKRPLAAWLRASGSRRMSVRGPRSDALRFRLCRVAMALALLAGWLASLAAPALAQGVAEADTLNKQVGELYRQGKYAEALAPSDYRGQNGEANTSLHLLNAL
jgi:hypothetical protein